MKGIVLLSHGPLAKGMYETTKWFMGDEIPQYTYVCLNAGESPEDYDGRILKAIEEVDEGEGVVLFADLLGGTPCNRAAIAVARGNVDLIAGMNLSMVLQLLGNRLSDEYDMAALEEVGKNGCVYVNALLASSADEDDDE